MTVKQLLLLRTSGSSRRETWNQGRLRVRLDSHVLENDFGRVSGHFKRDQTTGLVGVKMKVTMVVQADPAVGWRRQATSRSELSPGGT